MDTSKLLEFCKPFYENKDIMHNMWHIELVIKYADKIILEGNYKVNYESLKIAAYFHGFVYSDEFRIVEWLKEQNVSGVIIKQIIEIAWESQRSEVPQTLEGKILHDAHVIEGGKTYLITKCLITGSVRGQTLQETISVIEKYVLDNNKCYLPESIPMCEESNRFAKDFIKTLKTDIA